MPKATKHGASHHLRPGALDPRNRPEQLSRGVRYTSEDTRGRVDIGKQPEKPANEIESEDPSTDMQSEILSRVR